MEKLNENELVEPDADQVDNLRCPVCLQMFADPVFNSRGCQCTFCRSCIHEVLQRSESCPSCRAPIQPGDLVSARLAQHSINVLKVFCTYKDQGCFWTGRFDQRCGHVETCVAKQWFHGKSTIADMRERIRALEAKLAQRESDIDATPVSAMSQGETMKDLRTRIAEVTDLVNKTPAKSKPFL